MDALWRSRLRWRLRGAWMWPAFAVFTVVDAILVHLLPIAGEEINLLGALLIGAFFNLVAVAVLGPLTGLALRRRRRDLPRAVAADYCGAAWVVVITLGLLGAGLVHRPAIGERQDDFRAQSRAVRGYVLGQAPPEFRAQLARADTLRLEPDLYRTCIPGADPKRDLCLFVNTDQSPPGVRLDSNREPNGSFSGRDQRGRGR
jgi:hypothetical protein